MLTALYHRLPGPKAARVTILVVAAVVVFVLVIWSYEILGDLLDSGGTVGE
ncbi:MAG: hypothetical protein HKO63_03570 [Acidimicrobiia bacterium]|nr:hypothetical protein [Acidimicrobiia bacterium]MBT8193495.1 hypothetical protein [Acidimicrobiia bacterium]NNF87843.1 hypothetical protein [Acidimicrobiia bacterium]NNL13316.1 hypothetical protein [Acidimicrobiia bacterium]NNL97263.1 hypothetical protein [Acidimicrobiia bacterium]